MTMEVHEYSRPKESVTVNLIGTKHNDSFDLLIQPSIFPNRAVYFRMTTDDGYTGNHLTAEELDTVIASLMVVRQGIADST